MSDFLTEEYKSKWEYIRHTEKMRETSVQWYVMIIGFLVAISMGLAPYQAYSSGSRVMSAAESIQLQILLLAVLYSIAVCFHVIAQKRNYENYYDCIQKIEKFKHKDEYFEEPPSEKPRFFRNTRIVFFSILFFPTLIGASLTGLFFYALYSNCVWYVIPSLMYLAGVYILTKVILARGRVDSGSIDDYNSVSHMD